jgi:hypothetical protein
MDWTGVMMRAQPDALADHWQFRDIAIDNCLSH